MFWISAALQTHAAFIRRFPFSWSPTHEGAASVSVGELDLHAQARSAAVDERPLGCRRCSEVSHAVPYDKVAVIGADRLVAVALIRTSTDIHLQTSQSSRRGCSANWRMYENERATRRDSYLV